MLNRIPKSLRVLTILIICILPFGVMKTDYYFMSPGPPYQWDIEIEGANSVSYTHLRAHET